MAAVACRVEGLVRELKFPSYAVLRPVFFMEDLTTPWWLNGRRVTAGAA